MNRGTVCGMRGLPRHAELSRIVSCLLVGPLLAAGCGPIEYIGSVPLRAAGAISEAKQLDADRHAPYEITAAEQYIHKARVLAGYARFHSAVTFGDKAAENASKARQLSLERSKLPDERVEPASSEPSAVEVKTVERPGKVVVTPAPADKPAPPPAPPSPPPTAPPAGAPPAK